MSAHEQLLQINADVGVGGTTFTANLQRGLDISKVESVHVMYWHLSTTANVPTATVPYWVWRPTELDRLPFGPPGADMRARGLLLPNNAVATTGLVADKTLGTPMLIWRRHPTVGRTIEDNVSTFAFTLTRPDGTLGAQEDRLIIGLRLTVRV